MQIKDYLNKILEILSTNPFVESQSFSFEERPPSTARITGIITFTNSTRLNFKEFIAIESGDVVILKYGYNYSDENGSLIFRYDNALDPKAKKLSTYPEHKHIFKKILPAKRPTLKEVLREIADIVDIKK
ncbi:MAG: hypothetical protein A2042_09495 [Candidatus Schekmanbacteria bacterium GWA2_38_11]|uniref:Uncharacterized protein n=1 Tax=Candidatus Schekmanbacteria bacterium GWA2_38_11 TaxID=1817876 RepID=A0A1F7RM64_9BACT|nr:MAG: hypothetical protein A2042_09495 [Candidatus Schekmanbacteria bacterium GWA2_38_11]